MLTLPLVQFERSRIGAGVSTNADRRPVLDTALGLADGAPVATFSQAARTHRVSAATLDALIEALPVGLLVVDGDGEVSFANAVAATGRSSRMVSL